MNINSSLQIATLMFSFYFHSFRFLVRLDVVGTGEIVVDDILEHDQEGEIEEGEKRRVFGYKLPKLPVDSRISRLSDVGP